MTTAANRFLIQYDAEGLIDGKPFAAAYTVIDSDTGEIAHRFEVCGRGEKAEQSAERQALIDKNYLNNKQPRSVRQ